VGVNTDLIKLKESDSPENAAVAERDVAGGGLYGGKFEAPAKRGHQEGPNGGAVAIGDNDDVVVDSEAIGDRALANSRQRSGGLPEKMRKIFH